MNGIQEVSGSIPLISTKKNKACEVFTSQAFCILMPKVAYIKVGTGNLSPRPKGGIDNEN